MEIYTVGGFSEVGKNMTCVDTGKNAFLFDCGLFLPPIVELEETERIYTEKRLRRIGAVPNDIVLNKIRKKVRGIFISHAHLDHVGAIPWLAERYNADIFGTPFTLEVLKGILKDENIHLRNKLVPINPNSSYDINGNKVEFIHITHSTIQCSLICLHTKQGVVVYANDFKLDNTPIMGKKPGYDQIKRIARQGVKLLIINSLYSGANRKTPSEKIARDLLSDVLLTTTNKKAGLIITTFSSHIARLKSIVDFGKLLGREIVFVGRSLNKYVSAAKKAKLCPFQKDIKIASYKNQVARTLKRINKDRSRYLLVCTGHQGEPGSVLERMSRNKLPFVFSPKDHIIFSSSVIPAEANIKNREKMDNRLKRKSVRIFDNVHVSGHGSSEDLRELIEMLKPEHIIPAHGGLDKTRPMLDIARSLGYKKTNVHLMGDGKKLNIK